MITFLPAAIEHVRYVAANLRELDRKELEHTGTRDAFTALWTSWQLSDGNAVTAIADGRPIAMLGVAPNYLLGEGVPWMLGTPEVAKHQRDLLHWSRIMVTHWLTEFPILMNEVWVGNKPAMRYLRHVGFEFASPRQNEYGAEMAVFYKRRSLCAA